MVPESVCHFIGGQQVLSNYKKSFPVTALATGKECARVQVGRGSDVNKAVRVAAAAFAEGPWPRLTAAERAGVLNGIAAAVEARAGELAGIEALTAGLPVTQARQQIAYAAQQFRQAATAVTAWEEGAGAAPGRSSYTVRYPAGVAGVITSWRTPFLAQARALAPALAAGCTVVLAPDTRTPLSAALLPEIVTRAGLPGGALNIVHGNGDVNAAGARSVAVDALIAGAEVPLISFAGEAAAGQQVASDAAARGKRLTAQLAGAGTPCLIFADADLDQATDSAVSGAFALNGQRLTATSRIIAERPVYDALVTRFAERASRIVVGDPSDPATEIGPLVHRGHYDAAMAQVRLAVREGARLAVGGRRPAGLPEGNYLPATVFADVTPEMRIFAEGSGWPLVCLVPFDTEEEAVSLANAVKGGSAAYLWTSDLERPGRLVPGIEAGTVWVNSHNEQDLPAPSGGIDFFTRSWAVRVAADGRPAPRFGS